MANIAGDSVGIMEGAFFVGRAELLAWINDLLKLNLTKIEQTASGAVHCQIMDVVFPGAVPMHKVNWGAKYDHEYVKNYKILQEIFTKQGIKRYIEVEKLIKAKYQDNLEFTQWMKSFYDKNCHGPSEDYDPVERRKGAVLYGTTAAVEGQVHQAKQQAPQKQRQNVGMKAEAKGSHAPFTMSKPEQGSSVQTEEQKKQIQELEAQLSKLQFTNKQIEEDRDYYYQKLTLVELLCQSVQTEATSKVYEILESNEENEEFYEEGNVNVVL